MSVERVTYRDGAEETWIVKCAPQVATDILVQVYRNGEDRPALFTFCIGELIREEAEGHVYPNGIVLLTDAERECMERWADQMELYACILRSSIKRAYNEDGERPTQDLSGLPRPTLKGSQ